MDFNVAKNALIPVDDDARAKMRELSIGEKVRVRIQRAPTFRDYVHMIFARIGKVRGKSVQNIAGWLAIATGRCDIVPLPGDDSRSFPVPHSTSSMNAVEFEAFWEDAREVILQEILPLLPAADAAAIRDMIEHPRRGSWS